MVEKIDVKRNNNQKKWIVIMAEYNQELYLVEKVNLHLGDITPTKFKGFDFIPNEDLIEDVSMVIHDNIEDYESYINFFSSILKSK